MDSPSETAVTTEAALDGGGRGHGCGNFASHGIFGTAATGFLDRRYRIWNSGPGPV